MPIANKNKITLKWENSKEFLMEFQNGDDEEINIIRLEENGKIKDIWEHVAKICNSLFAGIINEVGNDMMKPPGE